MHQYTHIHVKKVHRALAAGVCIAAFHMQRTVKEVGKMKQRKYSSVFMNHVRTCLVLVWGMSIVDFTYEFSLLSTVELNTSNYHLTIRNAFFPYFVNLQFLFLHRTKQKTNLNYEEKKNRHLKTTIVFQNKIRSL